MLLRKARERRRLWGATLVEMMVAVSIVSVGILGLFGAFRFISISLHRSRVKTLVTNMAEDQIESLKHSTYYGLLVTTSPASMTTPYAIPAYDNLNYPPANIVVDGITYTKYTEVDLAELSSANAIQTVPPSNQDTGFKQITAYIVWSDPQTGWNVFKFTNLLQNPNAMTSLDAGFQGTVKDSSNNPIFGTQVYAPANLNWNAMANTSGDYAFSVPHGTYTVIASSAGFLPVFVSSYAAANSTYTTVNFTLTAIASGTVVGNVYHDRNNLLISQVVAATTTATCTGICAGFAQAEVEYVELFNPTTRQINIYNGAPTSSVSQANENILLETYDYNTLTTHDDIIGTAANLGVYVSTFVQPRGYYLIANKSTFTINGSTVAADAYYTVGSHYIPPFNAGGVRIHNNGTAIIDQLCWDGVGGPPPPTPQPTSTVSSVYCLGSYIPTSNACGMNTGYAGAHCTNPALDGQTWVGNQLVRFSSPTTTVPIDLCVGAICSRTYGSAYNSGWIYWNSTTDNCNTTTPSNCGNASDFAYPSASVASSLGNSAFYMPYTNYVTVKKIPQTLVLHSTAPVISGVPALNAFIATSTDAYSGAALSTPSYVINGWGLAQMYTTYALKGVSVGTWSIDIVSNDQPSNATFQTRVNNVSVSQGIATPIPNTITTPPWTIPGIYNTVMSTDSNVNFIEGQTADSAANPISGLAMQDTAGHNHTTGPNGLYLFQMGAFVGVTTVTANVNSVPPYPQYAIRLNNLTNPPGGITVLNFQMAQTATLQLNMKEGVTPVPNIVFIATDTFGNLVGEAPTDPTGNAYIHNLTTGTYTLSPVLGPGQFSSPQTTTLTPAQMGGPPVLLLFTMTGALASIKGQVTCGPSSAPMHDGSLIIASTNTITTPPTAIYGSSATITAPTFAVSSQDNGNYTLPVQAIGSTYNLLVSVPSVGSNGTVTMITNTATVAATVPGQTYTRNINLPSCP